MSLHLAQNNLPCRTCHHVFMWRNRQRFQKWWMSSNIPNYIRRSGNCWLWEFWAWPILALRSPNTMGYWYRKNVRSSYKYAKWSSMEEGRYGPKRGSRLLPATTSQLTTFGPWNHVDSMLLPWGWSWTNRPNPPCALPAEVVISCNHNTLHSNLLRK